MEQNGENLPVSAWFLGPKSEQAGTWQEVIDYIFQDYAHWRRNYFPEDPLILDRGQRRSHDVWFDRLSNELDFVLNRLKADYPFHSPRYLAHMISETSMPAIMGYLAGMLYNPNNVSEEGAPVTVALEIEAGKMIAKMLGYDTDKSWSHITSGGTLANMEAMWMARQAQWIPLMVWEICQQNDMEFTVSFPDGSKRDIRNANLTDLLHLKLEETLAMAEKLASRSGISGSAEACAWVARGFYNSQYNIGRKGAGLYGQLQVEPVIFVSEAAHYSIRKVANLLGWGDEQVISVPVDKHFRIAVDKLEEMLFSLEPSRSVIAIIGIMGTTEEGAIDPIHEIVGLRTRYEKERNRSFWVHADAAWGGYLRSIYIEDPDMSVQAETEVFQNEAIKMIHLADSITVDPHKLGYIQYPSGVINFKDKRAVLYARQKAPYINDETETYNPFDTCVLDASVGPFIIEGSKPGAAALATWLSHKTIPLHRSGHGKIIRESLANAQRLYNALCGVNPADNILGILPLMEPDSNVVCYFFRHYEFSLKENNKLNKLVYENISLKSGTNKHLTPYNHDFFVSRTHLSPDQYSWESVKEVISDAGFSRDEYLAEGLFVLRSVVVNPWLSMSREKGIDYLGQFVEFLKEKATSAIVEMKNAHSLSGA